MAETTNISWCTHTWSPWFGCTQVSMGPQGACEGCYARQMSEVRFGRVVFGGPRRGEGTRDVRADSAWKAPLKWQREVAALERAWHSGPDGGMGRPYPYRPSVFPSMCDPFDNHPALVEPRHRFFDLIRATPNLTWLLLTKRPGNIAKLWRDADVEHLHWPRNAAIGCTVVSQEEAGRDIPKLLAAKAALNPAFAFLSMEPLLGPVDLRQWLGDYGCGCGWGGCDTLMYCNACGWRGGGDETSNCGGCGEALSDYCACPECDGHDGDGGSFGPNSTRLDWVITGGETDQGKHKARPSNPAWFRSLRDQCAAAGVPFHFKQWGEWQPADAAGIAEDGPLSYQNGHVPDWMDRGVKLLDGSVRRVRAHSFTPHATNLVYHVGKKYDPCTLDGMLHDAMPEVRRG